jgi:Domain of unknown function (DUF1998)
VSWGSIRRAQLVSPFGVGAMSILVNGTSVITAGLDHWFKVDDPDELQLGEYQAQDWRLEQRLQVCEFRLPPDYRIRRAGNNARNTGLRVPVLRFPRWSFCMYCKRLKLSPLTLAQAEECPDPKHREYEGGVSRGIKRRAPRMSQVPFVAICAHGHLDDFPFREWVHRSLNPGCNGTLRLESRGGGGLEGQAVVCDSDGNPRGCGRERSLEGITNSHWEADQVEHTTLTDQLVAKDQPYYCRGARPWLAETAGTCGEPIRGALRGAGNVYFPKVESSIYLPRQDGAISGALRDLLNRADVRPTLRILSKMIGASVDAEQIRDAVPAELFSPITDEELLAGYRDMFGFDAGDPAHAGTNGAGNGDDRGGESAELLTSTDVWRHPEFGRLRETPVDDLLKATDPGVHPELVAFMARVRRIETLTETRVLRGFTRVRDTELKLSVGKALLRRRTLNVERDWLPAYVVKGEGIYIELDQDRLQSWEQRLEVSGRAQKITDHYGDIARLRGTGQRTISPRFVLIHTLAHLIINELIFACGYSSASLRERLYVSGEPGQTMAGLLIYTAAGDSEGTMGGLVRMAKPENLRSVMSNAISKAHWCSTDPVCMDAGEKGQGPDSCNLAACHGCALLPETSCEEFNRFLDRGLVIGTFDNPALGYFADLLV